MPEKIAAYSGFIKIKKIRIIVRMNKVRERECQITSYDA